MRSGGRPRQPLQPSEASLGTQQHARPEHGHLGMLHSRPPAQRLVEMLLLVSVGMQFDPADDEPVLEESQRGGKRQPRVAILVVRWPA